MSNKRSKHYGLRCEYVCLVSRFTSIFFSFCQSFLLFFFLRKKFLFCWWDEFLFFFTASEVLLLRKLHFCGWIFFLRNELIKKKRKKKRKAPCLTCYSWPKTKISDLFLKEKFCSAPRCLWPKNIIASFITAVGLSHTTGLNKWKVHYYHTHLWAQMRNKTTGP